MHLGLLSLGDNLTDPVTGVRMSPSEKFRSLVEQGVLAEQAGFTSVHLGEHHFCDYILSSPQVVLAAIGERTSRIKLSTGVILGANLDPVRVAEDYATIDLLSDGRVEPVIGRGTFFPHTFASFGQDPATAKEVFAENLELLLRIWETDGPVTWTGRFRAPLHEISVEPRPMQRPRPQVWLGAGSSKDSVELAARLGLRLIVPTVFGTPAQFRPMVDHYLACWDAAGRDRADARIGAVSHCHVNRTAELARRTWEPRYTTYMNWVTDFIARGMGASSVPPFDYDATVRDMAVVGSPAEVVDRIGQMRDLLHLDTHLVKFDMGGMPHHEVAATIERFGAEVIPQLA